MRGEAVGNIKNKRVQNPLKIRSLKPLDDPTIKSVKVSVVEMLVRLIEPVGMYSITDATLLNECANYTTNKDLDRIGFCTKKLLNHVFSIRILSIFINKFNRCFCKIAQSQAYNPNGIVVKEVRNNPYRLRWLIGVMSNEAWRAVYGHSLDKRHNKVNRTPIPSPSGSGKKHPELCCSIGAVVERLRPLFCAAF